MFCALNGATATPCRASHRQSPAVTTDFPASEVVPATRSAPTRRRLSHAALASLAGLRTARPSEPGAAPPDGPGSLRSLDTDSLSPGRVLTLYGPCRPAGTVCPALADETRTKTARDNRTCARSWSETRQRRVQDDAACRVSKATCSDNRDSAGSSSTPSTSSICRSRSYMVGRARCARLAAAALLPPASR